MIRYPELAEVLGASNYPAVVFQDATKPYTTMLEATLGNPLSLIRIVTFILTEIKTLLVPIIDSLTLEPCNKILQAYNFII